MKTLKLILIAFIIIYQYAYTQISKGGLPKSYSITEISDYVLSVRMPVINADSLLLADAKDERTIRPFRFGYAIDVDFGLNNSGTWDTLANGDKIWRLKIISDGAYSINLIYDDIWLPEGAQFFVYNKDYNMILGAFTSDVVNNNYNMFATDLVKGEKVMLEYYEPRYANGGRINIDKVIHGYINLFSDGLGQSAPCNIDVNCPQGNDWCAEKLAVSMILIDDNTAFCSGCLINNVRQDLTPYFLTADHCIAGLEGTKMTWIFRFKYWRPACNDGVPSLGTSITGATIRARNGATDFALLELSFPILSGSGLILAGWERTSSPATSATGIHHPRGDAMKISRDFNPVTSVAWEFDPNENYWRAIFDEGIVQPGSSGSPLFNQNHKIVGQLRGYQNNQCSWWDNVCFCIQEPVGEYGKIDVSWAGGATPFTRLSDWLDPDNTGNISIGHTSPPIYLINRTLTGTHRFAALSEIHIKGSVTTKPGCPPSNIPFTAEPGSNTTIKAKTISIHPETEFKIGSDVTIVGTNYINCDDNIIRGDYIWCK